MSGQRTDRGQGSGPDFPTTRVSCSQKGLPSPTVTGGQSRRALFPPRREDRPRNGAGAWHPTLESSRPRLLSQALRKGYRAKGREIGKLTFPQRNWTEPSLPDLLSALMPGLGVPLGPKPAVFSPVDPQGLRTIPSLLPQLATEAAQAQPHPGHPPSVPRS